MGALGERFWGHVQRAAPAECWEWAGYRRPAGYGQFRTRGRVTSAHRVSWEMHNGPIPPGLYVCHRCDNPPCVNPAHLFLGTQTQNMADKLAKGRHRASPGEKNGMAKLSESQVREIRAAFAAGERLKPLARRFGVSDVMVGFIVKRRSWRHLPETT